MKKNDVGALLIFTITSPSDAIVDVSMATSPTLCIYTGHTLTSHVATIYNGTGGQIAYQVAPGDLPSTGVYKFEVHFGFAGGEKFTSSRTFDTVLPTLCPST